MNPVLLLQVTSGSSTPVDPGGGGGSGGPGVPVAWSDDVVDTLGVNVHTGYDTTYIYRKQGPYPSAVEAMKSALSYVGIRHVRDICNFNDAQRTALKAFKNDLGIDTLMTAGTFWNGKTPPSMASLTAEYNAYYKGVVTAFEGPNESDLSGRSDWVNLTRTYQAQLYSAGHTLGLPVLSPAIGHAGKQTYYTQLGSVDGMCDIGNFHIYTGGLKPSNNNLANTIKWVGDNNVSTSKLLYQTEGGDHDATHAVSTFPPVTEAVSGVYAPILLLELYRRGVDRFYRYQLGDDRADNAYTDLEKHLGLFAWNQTVGTGQSTPAWRAKPNATALRNLVQLLADPGVRYTPAPLVVSISGGDTSLRYLIFGKRDGTYLIAVWRDVSIWTPSTSVKDGGKPVTVSPQTITVTLGTPANVKRYQPSTSANVLNSATSATTYSFPVAGECVVLKIG